VEKSKLLDRKTTMSDAFKIFELQSGKFSFFTSNNNINIYTKSPFNFKKKTILDIITNCTTNICPIKLINEN
jgi:hypothetical protein